MSTHLNHRPLREVVTDELRRMILERELLPGERLIEDKLAEQLGVSRNPVREAIRSLEATGIVEVLPRRGAYVTAVDLNEVAEIQEMRQAIDGWVVSAAAMRHDESDIARIDQIIEDGRRATDSGDLVRASEMHREFHLAIEAASKNRYASVAMEPLRQRTEMVFMMNAGYREDMSWDEHQGIRDAIAARDADRAKTLVQNHIRDAFAAFVALSESAGANGAPASAV